MNNQITLPSIKHVFDGLFLNEPSKYEPTINSPIRFHRRSPSLPQICPHCHPPIQFAHRRTQSDQLPHPNQPIRHTRAHTSSGYPTTEPKLKNAHRYHCQHCNKSFSRPSSLRIHIYSHTGEKPFQCHFQGCGRSFSVHSNMRRHLRVHYCPQQQQQQQNSMRLPIVPPSYFSPSFFLK